MNPPLQDVGVENFFYFFSFIAVIVILGIASMAWNAIWKKSVLLLMIILITIGVIAYDQHLRIDKLKSMEEWKRANALNYNSPIKEDINKIYFLKFESDHKAIARIYLAHDKTPKTLEVNIVEDKNIKNPVLISDETVKIKNLQIKQLIFLNTEYELSNSTNKIALLNKQEIYYQKIPWFDYFAFIALDIFFSIVCFLEIKTERRIREANAETVFEEENIEENVEKAEKSPFPFKRKIRT